MPSSRRHGRRRHRRQSSSPSFRSSSSSEESRARRRKRGKGRGESGHARRKPSRSDLLLARVASLREKFREHAAARPESLHEACASSASFTPPTAAPSASATLPLRTACTPYTTCPSLGSTAASQRLVLDRSALTWIRPSFSSAASRTAEGTAVSTESAQQSASAAQRFPSDAAFSTEFASAQSFPSTACEGLPGERRFLSLQRAGDLRSAAGGLLQREFASPLWADAASPGGGSWSSPVVVATFPIARKTAAPSSAAAPGAYSGRPLFAPSRLSSQAVDPPLSSASPFADASSVAAFPQIRGSSASLTSLQSRWQTQGPRWRRPVVVPKGRTLLACKFFNRFGGQTPRALELRPRAAASAECGAAALAREWKGLFP